MFFGSLNSTQSVISLSQAECVIEGCSVLLLPSCCHGKVGSHAPSPCPEELTTFMLQLLLLVSVCVTIRSAPMNTNIVCFTSVLVHVVIAPTTGTTTTLVIIPVLVVVLIVAITPLGVASLSRTCDWWWSGCQLLLLFWLHHYPWCTLLFLCVRGFCDASFVVGAACTVLSFVHSVGGDGVLFELSILNTEPSPAHTAVRCLCTMHVVSSCK